MNTLDLNKMGLEPMTEFEMQTVDGGGFWAWIAGALEVAAFVVAAVGTAGLAMGLAVGAMVAGALD